MSNVLTQREGGAFVLHPEGIYAAICRDVIAMGKIPTEWQGQRRMTEKVKIIWECGVRLDDGTVATISKNFTASLGPTSALADALGKWRGRPVQPGECIDLDKLIGACCTLVISHQTNAAGRVYAAIDAISKPTRKIAPSDTYDAAKTRQAVLEWAAKQRGEAVPARAGGQGAAPQWAGAPHPAANAPLPRPAAQPQPQPRQAAVAAPVADPAGGEAEPAGFDPDVGF